MLSRCSDLKPENILLDDQGHLALCDMGFAVKAEQAFKRLGWVSSRGKNCSAVAGRAGCRYGQWVFTYVFSLLFDRSYALQDTTVPGA